MGLRENASEPDWDALYAEQLPRVYNFLRYRVGSADAEDLTSRVFLKAWTHRHSYRSNLSAFGTWLMSIARNEAVDFLRRVRPTEPLDPATLVTGATSEDAMVRSSAIAQLQQLLSALGERDRDLISLKYGGELTNREIARLTGLSESNVGTILSRVVSTLRDAWYEKETR